MALTNLHPRNIIHSIMNASKFEDVISADNFQAEFKNVAKEIHPDRCKIPMASEAMMKLNQWRDYFENGKEYKDDCGTYKTNGYWVEFTSTEPNLSWSIENFRLIKDLKDEASEHFKKYIPERGKLTADGKVRFEFSKRAIPLSGLLLPQEHVNWVLSRLLEYSAYLSQIGFVHCGFNPESIFIIPESHGLQICSFYHWTRFGNRVKTISGKYKNWYPPSMFIDKSASSLIDIELSKKIACYLLGEPSGNAIKLRKTHNEDFINFLVDQHKEAYPILTLYRNLLAKNFKKEFHLLTI